MASRGRRFRTRESSRTREASPPSRIRPDHFDIRSHNTSPLMRSRGRSPDLRDRTEASRFREHEERKRMRWEEEKRDRSNGRSRSHNRVDHRDKRSRSGGRRSTERRGGDIRFEPPVRRFQEEEFAARRRRSVSGERNRRQRHSSQDRHWEEDGVMNKFSPPGPSRFPHKDFQEPFGNADQIPANMTLDIWNNQMQPSVPIEASTPIMIGNQGFNQNQGFAAPQSVILNQPFMENQEFPQSSVANQGLPQSQGFASHMMDNPQQLNPDNEGHVIPDFNPETSKLSSSEWIRLIEDVGKQRDWKKDEKHYIMTSRLAGFARQWYLTTGINHKWWSELKVAFLKAFPTEMEFFTLLKKMIARTREDNETLSAYFHHKAALLNACEIHGRKAVSCIIAGLQNPKLQQQVKAQNCEDPDSLYMYLRTCSEEHLAVPKKPKVEDPKNKNKTPVKPSKAKTLSCFFCKSTGHLVAQCPQKQHRCTVCFEYGHECAQPGKNEKNLNMHNSVMHGSLSRKPTFPKYFTDVGINNIALKAYVDQASECTTIREENALAMNLPVRKQYKVIRGFRGSSISSMGIVDTAVCIDRAMANVRLFVVPDHIQAIPVVVGQSFTEQPHVVVMKDGDKIRFYQRMDNGETNFDF